MLTGLAIFAGAWLYTGYRPSWLLVDWTGTDRIPFKVDRTLEFASRWYPLKSGSLSLLCGPSGLHIMAKGRLLGPAEYHDETPTGATFLYRTAVMFDPVKGNKKQHYHEILTRSAIVEVGSVDTIVTNTLNEDAEATIVGWFHRGTPYHVSFFIDETAIGRLNGRATEKEVADFVRECGLGPRMRDMPPPSRG